MDQERQATPAHQRLSNDLRTALAEGRFKVGERMPTEVELAEAYSVSRQTVRRAFQDLVGEGLVHRVAGRGTFPTNLSRPGHYIRSIGAIEDLQAFAGTDMEILQQIALVAEEEAAYRLQLPSEVVSSLTLRRLYNNAPFALTRVYLPPAVGQRLAEAQALPNRGPGTVIGTLERIMPGAISGANQVITAVTVPPEVAPLIGLEAGLPCLRAERTYFDTESTPMEYALSFYNPNRYSYQLHLRRRTT